MTDIKMSEMAADNAIGGQEKLLALDSTTSKTITTAAMAAYVVDTLLAASAATPTTGDSLVAERSGTKSSGHRRPRGLCGRLGWSQACYPPPRLGLFLVNRSGTITAST